MFRAQGRRTSTGDDDHDALLDRLRSPYESDNPFERLWKPRTAEPLLIGLMSTTLDNATTEDTFILDALEDDRAWAIDWVCAPGGSRFNRDGLGLEVEGNSPDSL